MKNYRELLWEIYQWGWKNKLHPYNSFPTFYDAEYRRYKNKKNSSKHEFTLTFEQWVLLWDRDMLHNYNNRYKKKMLCRIQEPGPYSIENVYIGLPIDNSHDCIRNSNHPTAVYDPCKHKHGYPSKMP